MKYHCIAVCHMFYEKYICKKRSRSGDSLILPASYSQEYITWEFIGRYNMQCMLYVHFRSHFSQTINVDFCDVHTINTMSRTINKGS